MGETNLPTSYITYLLLRLTGIEFPETIIDKLTLILFLLALALSVFSNVRHGKVKKAN